jgi:hypothetical protein
MSKKTTKIKSATKIKIKKSPIIMAFLNTKTTHEFI